MTTARFLQLHWLASYPGTLLNRDDAGLAKRLPFGGSTRGRVSSQSLKRHWRLAGADDLEAAAAAPWALQRLPIPAGVRSKFVVEQRIMPLACSGVAADEAIVVAVQKALLEKLYGEKSPDPKKRQVLFFGEPEIAFLAEHAAKALGEGDPKQAAGAIDAFFKQQRVNLRALKDGAGLESALWGRMVTSDPAANRDAAVHVAHAFTVHALERELDFMTVVDDLKRREDGDDAGAAGVFDMELTSGLYYGYLVVDVPLLAANLSGDREVAAQVIEHLVHLVAQVSPGAKKGSTAPYAWAEHMLLELGERQPRTLANAFRDPVSLRTNRLAGETVSRLDDHLRRLDAAYGSGEVRRQLVVEHALADIPTLPLDAIAAWAAAAVREDAPA